MNEKIRSDFERWYEQQPMDQIATWHEKENRYTLFSQKNNCWTVWQAAHFKYSEDKNEDHNV